MSSLPDLYFATSGIRGKANTVISPELGLRVGRAVAQWLQSQSKESYVYVGYDNRRNSRIIASTISAGLSSAGINVKFFTEAIPTPLVIFSTVSSEADAGVMITGSHLPRDENGIILFDNEGKYFKGVLPDSKETPVAWDKLGMITSTTTEILDYKNFLNQVSKNEKLESQPLNILLDPVHGPMRSYLELVLSPFVRDIIKFNWTDDDTFPGRLSEPTPSNLVNTAQAVQIGSCDFGVATDMDGDRIIFITKDGEVISGDYIGALLAKRFWNEFPDIPIVIPINTSAIINYVAEEMGTEFIYCRVGPPSIINAMVGENAKYAFEETGKYFFNDYAIWPDAAVSLILILSYLQSQGTTLEEELAKLPRLYTLKTKVPFSRKISSQLKDEVGRTIRDQFDNIREINDMDGFRVNFNDKSWILIRPSGTEDYVRVFTEHYNEEENQKLNKLGQRYVKDIIGRLNPD